MTRRERCGASDDDVRLSRGNRAVQLRRSVRRHPARADRAYGGACEDRWSRSPRRQRASRPAIGTRRRSGGRRSGSRALVRIDGPRAPDAAARVATAAVRHSAVRRRRSLRACGPGRSPGSPFAVSRSRSAIWERSWNQSLFRPTGSWSTPVASGQSPSCYRRGCELLVRLRRARRLVRRRLCRIRPFGFRLVLDSTSDNGDPCTARFAPRTAWRRRSRRRSPSAAYQPAWDRRPWTPRVSCPELTVRIGPRSGAYAIIVAVVIRTEPRMIVAAARCTPGAGPAAPCCNPLNGGRRFSSQNIGQSFERIPHLRET